MEKDHSSPDGVSTKSGLALSSGHSDHTHHGSHFSSTLHLVISGLAEVSLSLRLPDKLLPPSFSANGSPEKKGSGRKLTAF